MPVYLAYRYSGVQMIKETDGIALHYETAGEKGSRVLLLHGWGCDISLMKPVADALKADHRVMMIDFPGHGKSGRPPEPWGVPEYAENLEKFLHMIGFTPCAVIAHSFGCRVATYIAAEYPEMFTKMIFTGAAGIRPRQSAEAQARTEKYKKLKKRAEKIKKIPLLRGAAEHMEEKLRHKYGSADYNSLDEDMRKTFVKVVNQDLTDIYNKIRISTLLIWGENDTETPIWMGREIESRIADCALIPLEGGTHFAYLEQIGRFNTIAAQFLKED